MISFIGIIFLLFAHLVVGHWGGANKEREQWCKKYNNLARYEQCLDTPDWKLE